MCYFCWKLGHGTPQCMCRMRNDNPTKDIAKMIDVGGDEIIDAFFIKLIMLPM